MMTITRPADPRWQPPEPPKVDDVVIKVVIGSVVFWALILPTPLFRFAPSTSPVGQIVIGGPLLLLNALVAALVIESAWLKRTEAFNQRVAQLKTWRVNLELAERRRRDEQAPAEAARHVQIARNAMVREDIAKTEQRIRELEAEHATTDSKIKEASQ